MNEDEARVDEERELEIFFSARVPQAINANKYWSSKVSADIT